MLFDRLLRIAAVSLSLFLLTCDSKKEDPRPTALPAITQKGANTFGCLVNRELMVAVDKCRGVCPPNPHYDPSIGFGIQARMDSTDKLTISNIGIQLDYINKEGDYLFDTLLNDPLSANLRCGLYVNKYVREKFSILNSDSGTSYRGELRISKWVKGQNGFVAGTFWFDLYNPGQYSDTVRVREGRFDIPFN
jgi:hypothetical protein